MSKRAQVVANLAEHPNVSEVLGVLAQVVSASDEQLAALARAWVDRPEVARARDLALSPDSPLVCEVLAAFESLAFLYADDLHGQASFATLPAPVVALALKAARDAIAGAYARPVLPATDHRLLLGPWRAVFSDTSAPAPDFGPCHDAVVAALELAASLACRSHDVDAARRWSAVSAGVVELDRHADAVDAAWQAAVLLGRRRTWALLHRSVSEAYDRRCPDCQRAAIATEDEEGAVLALCIGAVVGRLVGDALDDADAAVLAQPLASLVPAPRAPDAPAPAPQPDVY